MSDLHPDFDLHEQIARISRMQAETEKFASEQRKLAAEQSKLAAEQNKLAAEAVKLAWDVRLAPYFALAALIGGLLGLATFIAHLMGH